MPRLLLVSLLLGFFQATAEGAGQTAVIAVGGDVDSFNEYVAGSTLAYEMAGELFLGLMEEQPGSPPVFLPRLARSWTIAEGGLSVTFHLRKDVRWSDGTPTTAEDVRYTWQVQTDPDLGWVDADLKVSITDVRVDDPYTVTFLLSKASPYTLVDINEGRIIPKHAWKETPVKEWFQTDFSKNMVTNGPFRLAGWKPGQAIFLERNPDYYEENLPGLDRIVMRIIPEPAIRLQQLLAGETDVLDSIPPETVDRIVKNDSLEVVRVDQRMYAYLCWNNRRPPFDDAKVRRALTLGLDREAMLRVLAQGMGRPSTGPIVSSLWAADPSLRPLPHDPASARRLLTESGWTDTDGDGLLDKDGQPFTFDLEFNRGNTLREKIVLNTAAQLEELGIRAVPRAVEWTLFNKKHRDGDYDAFVAARIASTRVNLDSYTSGDGRNYPGYSNPKLDALNDRATAAASFDAARPLWYEAQRIIQEDQPVTFLFEQDRLHAVSVRLTGVKAGSLGLFSGLRMWRVRQPAADPTARRE